MDHNTAKKILLVDDDEDDIFLISDTIGEIAGRTYDITSTSAPADAIQKLAEGQFDVILSDYMLGSMSGIEFIKQLQSEGIDTPVILLTGLGNNTVDQEALEAGAADFLSKTDLGAKALDRAIRYAIANSEKQRLLQAVLNNANASVAVIDEAGEPVLWNANFAELVDWNLENKAPGGTVKELIDIVANHPEVEITTAERIHDRRMATLPDRGTVITLHDVTGRVKALEERRAAERRIAYIAQHDTLTGIANRTGFSDEITERIRNCIANGWEFYLLNLDLNRFKEVNDVFGHAVGDLLLQRVANEIEGCLEDDEFVARLGGDEFVAVQPKKPGDDGVPSLAHRILENLSGSFKIGDKLVRTGVSIGVSVFPEHGEQIEELLSNADIAMYRAKETPQERVTMFDARMDKAVRKRRVLANELKEAVIREELDVYFQPQAEVNTGKLIGFEALARWNHPEHGFVAPDTFISIAEENGLIIELGEYVLNRACEIAKSWPGDIAVAINVSTVQIRHTDLVSLVHAALLRTGIAPQQLEIEVTESVLIEDTHQTLHVLRGIKNMGVSIAMDDFGTGYSSLSSLLAFPFDRLKIDRTFVERIQTSKRAKEILRSIIGLGNNMNFKVLAEGVDCLDHVDFLREEKCAEMQGFLLSKPVPEAGCLELICNGLVLEERPEDVLERAFYAREMVA